MRSFASLRMTENLKRPAAAVGAAAMQELAADLDPLLAVIFDDVGGGVGLRPVRGQERAGADDVDRRLGFGHDPAFGRAEARRGHDLNNIGPSEEQGAEQMKE